MGLVGSAKNLNFHYYYYYYYYYYWLRVAYNYIGVWVDETHQILTTIVPTPPYGAISTFWGLNNYLILKHSMLKNRTFQNILNDSLFSLTNKLSLEIFQKKHFNILENKIICVEAAKVVLLWVGHNVPNTCRSFGNTQRGEIGNEVGEARSHPNLEVCLLPLWNGSRAMFFSILMLWCS